GVGCLGGGRRLVFLAGADLPPADRGSSRLPQPQFCLWLQDSPIRLAGYSDTRQTLSRVLESRRGVSGEVDETACRCLNASGVQGDRVSQRGSGYLEQPAPPTSPLRPLR